MTKRGRRKAALHKPAARSSPIPPQARCETCGRYRVVGEACWFCHPEAPEHCHCDDIPLCHAHIDHHLFERLWQIDLESVDETILLDTERWPDPAEERRRQAWRDDPSYKAFLRSNSELRRRSRTGIDSIFSYFGLTPREADAWSLQAAGYTIAAIAQRMKLKPGGVEAHLDSVQGKIALTMTRANRRSLAS